MMDKAMFPFRLLRPVAAAWDNGRGPWGNPQPRKPAGPRPAGRAAGGPAPQPELEDVLNSMAEGLRGFWRRGSQGGFGGDDPRFPLPMVAAGLVAVWLLSGFYIVSPEQQGVEQRFGRYTQTTDPGLNYHLPWSVETVTRVAVARENVTELGFRSMDGAHVDVPQESMMLTGDENIIDLDFTVRWKVSNPASYLFNVANAERTVADVAESVMREVIGKHPIDDVLTDNKVAIQHEARAHAQQVLDAYKVGVQVTGMELQQVNPPAEVLDAFRDVQAARADAEKAINQAQGYANQILPQARGQAARILQDAEAYKLATLAAAQGQASRFKAQVQAYQGATQVTRDRLYLEAMQEVLSAAPKVVVTGKNGGNVLPFLPLDRLMPAAGAPTNSAKEEGASR